MLLPNQPSPLQPLFHPAAVASGVRLYCKRDDLYTPAPETALQGNKVRKLAGVLRAALAANYRPVLVSFGGAYSNHLSALATAGKLYQLPVILYVRGEEVDNAILRRAHADGARLIHLSRSDYRRKTAPDWLQVEQNKIAQEFQCPTQQVWFIAEGGTGPGSARSVGQLYQEVVKDLGQAPHFLCLSAGTGGSAAGIIQAADPATRVEVFPALKGHWMQQEIERFLPSGTATNWALVTDYHFGGYGKFPPAWNVPSPGLAKRAAIGEPGLPPLEPIYTAKLFYGVINRLRQGAYPKGSSVVVVHTGGIY